MRIRSVRIKNGIKREWRYIQGAEKEKLLFGRIGLAYQMILDLLQDGHYFKDMG
jgi:hypothetical protein